MSQTQKSRVKRKILLFAKCILNNKLVTDEERNKKPERATCALGSNKNEAAARLLLTEQVVQGVSPETNRESTQKS